MIFLVLYDKSIIYFAQYLIIIIAKLQHNFYLAQAKLAITKPVIYEPILRLLLPQPFDWYK